MRMELHDLQVHAERERERTGDDDDGHFRYKVEI